MIDTTIFLSWRLYIYEILKVSGSNFSIEIILKELVEENSPKIKMQIR